MKTTMKASEKKEKEGWRDDRDRDRERLGGRSE